MEKLSGPLLVMVTTEQKKKSDCVSGNVFFPQLGLEPQLESFFIPEMK